MKLKNRSFGLDLIRSFACIFVVIVHAFINTNFQESNIVGMKGFFLLSIRWFTFICVPLFLLLTGYLKGGKKVDRKHYQAIKKILLVYLCISIITILYRIFALHDTTNLWDLILGIFNGNAIGYAWYVEMYIGLFLLIPFLNILYQNIEKKKHKQILILTLVFICSIPYTFSFFKIGDYRFDFLPMWWKDLYPILYYFIGCYIKEYQIKIKPVVNMICIFSILFLQSFVTLYICQNDTFLNSVVADYNAFPTILISTLFFLLFYQMRIHGKRVHGLFAKISDLSLSIYLFSWIFDRMVYRSFSFLLEGELQTFVAIVTAVPVVFLCSFLAAIILDQFILIITKFISYLIRKHREKYGIDCLM